MDPVIITEAANATAERLTGWTPREFTWGPLHRRGRRMLGGATWILFPNGTATFDATVVSRDDNSTWVIWHVDLLDRDGTTLGSLAGEHPVEGDWRKFVKTMPSNGEHYRFRALATFDKALWDDIAALKMYSSC
ncbi:DUF6294 family protein [Lentzea cavernae]|uniref:DUF6294 domain-containing protein n=1 Tax=Lentzea cavernae TaxID=2020703 RepID=A0ABQ3MGJ7_9PSEU|nr:DUF6294 family protein [Lentzea cavernae]GHH42570.1 hypothetical protein GCM10017774_39160 [Lentzea cavernae]